MQALIEQYNEINKKISFFNRQISDYQKQIESVKSQIDEEIPERIENLKKQIERIDEYQLKISGFIQLAEKHMTSKNLLSIEAPEGYRVNINRLKSWSMLIDPTAEDDVYAKKVYLVANCDKKFLEQKREEFSNRIKELESDYSIGAPAQIREFNQKIDAVKKQIKKYLDSEEITSFANKLRKYNEEKMVLDTPAGFDNSEKDPEFIVPGAYGTPLEVSSELRDQLKLNMGRFYDEKNSKVYLPVERIYVSEEFAMTISCVPARKKVNELDAGIRNLLFQLIDRSPAGTRKIYIIDALRENSALVGGLKGLEGSDVLEPVPRNDEQIGQTLERIVSNFSDIDDTLENYDTVVEYNEAVEPGKRIERSVIVLVGWPGEFKGENAEYAKRIFSNYERYGVSFIAVRISADKDKEKDGFGFSDYVGESVINIEMTMKETNISFGRESKLSFAWYPFKYQLPSDYCNAVKKLSRGKGRRVTDYSERGLLDGEISYTRGKKLLDLPYGVDGKDQLHSIVFENENFASFLMGASGSGKSTLLHSLITGIIKNYHPDDVELWLADFKMSEFAQYIDPMPPHVKYILLDESQELIFDLIDKLTEKMMERQRFFMKNRELKKVEKVPSDTYMPIIFVILDEFSIMSQAINENQQYRLKLQNLLAKGRALGIKFLFSSQTFTTGVSGLTDTAKAQIQMRIAMKAAKTEIVDTLELSPAQKTDQVQNWIDALPVYHALIKYRDSSDGEDRVLVRRTTVLYFDDKDSPGDPYKKQRELIAKINNKMTKVEEYDPSETYEYCDKEPVVVDGNSYDVYSEEIVLDRFEQYKQDNRVSSDETLISFGRPRLMSDMRIISMTQDSRENILMFAPVSEQMCALSVLVSVIKQYKLQNGNVEIWTYSKSKIYKNHMQVLIDLDCKIVEDIEAISLSVKKMKKEMDSGNPAKTLIVLFGMERICGDMGFTDTVPEREFVETKTKEFSENEWKNTRFAELWIPEEEKLKKKNAKKAEEVVNKILADARNKIISQVVSEWEKIAEERKQKAGEQSADNAESEEKDTAAVESGEAYNALNDFQALIRQGSRYGYHFAMLLSSLTDMRATSFSIDNFRHRLAFQMSVDDSRELFHSRVASSLPEHVCQYYDLLEGFSFRPYLNQGIDWDGWGVTEDGELISPFYD